MNKLITPIAVALGVAGGIIGAVELSTKPDAVQPVVAAPVPHNKLSTLSAECKTVVEELSPGLIAQDPECVPGETYMNSDTKPTKGWLCGGAWMPKAVQDCMGGL
jgi:hypothetical protein